MRIQLLQAVWLIKIFQQPPINLKLMMIIQILGNLSNSRPRSGVSGGKLQWKGNLGDMRADK